MRLDEAYRLAHLPLLNPDHPQAILSKEGTFYTMGRHPHVFSLVLPVSSAALHQSEPYRQLEAELRSAPFSAKVAWHLLDQRSDKRRSVAPFQSPSLPCWIQPPGPNLPSLGRSQ